MLSMHIVVKFSVCFSQAEKNRKKENQAAVLIQSWFRGCQVRAYIRYSVYSQCVNYFHSRNTSTFSAFSNATGNNMHEPFIIVAIFWVVFPPLGIKKHLGGKSWCWLRLVIIPLLKLHKWPWGINVAWTFTPFTLREMNIPISACAPILWPQHHSAGSADKLPDSRLI